MPVQNSFFGQDHTATLEWFSSHMPDCKRKMLKCRMDRDGTIKDDKFQRTCLNGGGITRQQRNMHNQKP